MALARSVRSVPSACSMAHSRSESAGSMAAMPSPHGRCSSRLDGGEAVSSGDKSAGTVRDWRAIGGLERAEPLGEGALEFRPSRSNMRCTMAV